MTAPCTQTERRLVAAMVRELWRQYQSDGYMPNPYTYNESLPEDGMICVDGAVDMLALLRVVTSELSLPDSGEARDTVPMSEDETRDHYTAVEV